MRRRWTGTDTFFAALVAVAFAWNVSRYWFLGDDGFICFRYARNLLDGHGLVYNPGERVEGYTTFSWVMLMAGAMKLGLAPEVASNAIGVACGATLLIVLVDFSRGAPRGEERARSPLAWLAPLALASNRTFTAWCTGGLATQLFALLVVAGVLALAVEREREPARVGWRSALLFAAAQLTRPEGVIFAAVGALVLGIDTLRGRRRPARLVGWCAAFAALPAAHFAWRLAYYGQPLPNTFYAKVSGLWLEQSTVYLRLFFADHLLWLFVPLLAFGFTRRGARTRRLLAAFVLAHLAYVLYVGGDRFEYRFLTPVLPLLYWLVAEAVGLAVERLPDAWRRPATVVLGGALIASAALPTFRPFEKQHGINSLENIARVAEMRAAQGRFLRELVDDGILPADTKLGVRGAGALPYYSGLPALDLHGLNDIEIARLEVDERGVIAHEKVATPDILAARGVHLCEVRNEIVYDAPPRFLDTPAKQAFYSGPHRCVEAKGKFLVFVTTLAEVEFRSHFRHTRIVQ